MSIVPISEGEPALSQPPFVLNWNRASLPVRPIRPVARRGMPILQCEPPPWLPSGPADQPFDLGLSLSRLCEDIVSRCEELYHVDVSRILFGVNQARNSRTHGLQARVTPLRFRNGLLTRVRKGVRFQVQRYFVDAREMLYLMTFCVPRFLQQDFDDKFITLFHELYHLSPAFDGDLRRHDGRCAIHSRSQRDYDHQMAHLARAYLAGKPDPALHSFMRLDFSQLMCRHGSVVGVMVPRPKLIPVPRGK